MKVLRPDQATLKQGIYSAWDSGKRAVLAVAPTGFGKSVVISDIINEKNQLGAMQCVIAHRVELVSQMSMHIAERGIRHRIIAPQPMIGKIIAKHRKEFNGRSFVAPDANCAVAGVDTLIARKDALAKWAAQIDDWTIDEAHHVLKHNKWGTAVTMFPRAKGLGVTASPCRADGFGLGAHHDGVFEDMILGPDMRTLINIGALCDYELVCPESDLVVEDDAFDKNGDLSPAKGRAASKKSHIVGDIVTQYSMRALGKQAIVFVTDVETAGDVAANFNAFGISAAAVSAKTPDDVRDEYVRRFRLGLIKVLVNVDLFGEGFDVPSVEVVIMARPTGSLAVYLQQFGRALRLLEGKLYGLIIDMVSNWKRHGFPDKQHYWSLDRRDKKAKTLPDPEEIDLRVCRECSRPYERFHLACPHCGAEPPLPAGGVRTIEQVDGDLILLDRETLAAMRAATVLDTPADVANRALFAGGPAAAAGAAARSVERWAAQERLKLAIAQWAAVQRVKGRDDRETHKRFYITTGVDVLSALALPRVDMESLSQRVEGWCVL